MCPCGVKSGNWIWFYKCIFGVTRDKVYITSHHHNIQILFACKDKEWKVSLEVIFLFSCLCSLWHIYSDGYRYVAVLQGACSYYLGSWIMDNFSSYCMHQEHFLIRTWSLQWKGGYHWEHSCGLMTKLSVIFGESCVGNMTHNVYVKGS
jgi:hypothetical protein